MSRRHAPHYSPSAIMVRAQLDPSGAHRLVVETDGGLMIAEYDADQVRQIMDAAEQFQRLVIVTDGGPDFHNRKTIPLEVGR